ncbi:MAG TPA: site-2 protease family protein [Anaerolineaceae bacterium]|nr:site-2 protease family protein [Anaerolineaceae bacterium]
MDFGSLFSIPVLISKLLILLVALPIHEFAHAWTADRFGDDTPRLNGRLTLNPLVHLDPIGSLLILVSGFGWARPVPINPYQLGRRSPSAVMWVSLAGPLSNLLLAILAALPIRLGLMSSLYLSGSPVLAAVPQILETFMFINLILFLFNLIPLAPLDGEKIFSYFFPASWSNALDRIRPYSPLILLLIVFVLPQLGLPVLNWIIGPPLNAISRLLLGG